MNFFIFAIFSSIAALAFAVDTLGIQADTFGPGGILFSGDSTFSPAGLYRLEMQPDGNLVVYTNNGVNAIVMWDAQTVGRGGKRAVMQKDGNFCIQNAAGENVWNTWTYDAGSVARLQDDGNLVVHSPNGYTVWSSLKGYSNKD